jgi:hypothetical protein
VQTQRRARIHRCRDPIQTKAFTTSGISERYRYGDDGLVNGDTTTGGADQRASVRLRLTASDERKVAVGVVRFGSTRIVKALASQTRLRARRRALPAESNYSRDGVEEGV